MWGAPTIRKHVSAMKAPFACPPNAHRLFDLISVDDPKFLPAFYFALSDTLVTTSLDLVGEDGWFDVKATKLAYSKKEVLYRVVTTSGQIIEKSGTMSGGGNSNKHGLMRLKDKSKRASLDEEVPTSSVEELEREVSVLNEAVERTQKQVSELTVAAKRRSE